MIGLVRKIQPLRLLAGMVCLAILLWSGPARASLVKNIRLGQHPDRTRLVVDLDGPFAFRMERPDPRRIKVDLEKVSLGGDLTWTRPGLGQVERYRISKSGTGVLLEVWLKEEGQIKAFPWDEAQRLVIDIEGSASGIKPSAKTRPEAAAPPLGEGPAAIQETDLSPQPAEPETVQAENHPTPSQERVGEGPGNGPPAATQTQHQPGREAEAKALDPQDTLGFFLAAEPVKLPPSAKGGGQTAKTGPEPFSRLLEADRSPAGGSRLTKRIGGPAAGMEAGGKVYGQLLNRPDQADRPGQAEGLPRLTMRIGQGSEAARPVSGDGSGWGPVSRPITGQPEAEETATTLGLTVRIRPEPPQDAGPVVEEEPGSEPAQPRPDQVAAEAKALAVEAKGEEAMNLVTARDLLNKGLALFKKGRYAEALDRFQEAEALSPLSSVGEKALFLQADCEFGLFKETGFPPFDQVERAYQKAVGAFPDSTETGRALLRMGIANYEGGNADKARGFLNLVIKEHSPSPEAVEAKVTLARLYLDENRPQPAISLLREVISASTERSPQLRTALWYLGRVLFEIGRYVEADQRLAEIIRHWPDFVYKEPLILYYLGETSFRLDRPEEARRYLYWVLNISPETVNQDLVLTRLGETYRLQGDLKKAAALYTESRRLFPESDGGLIAQIRLAETRNQKVALGKPAELDKVLGIEINKDAEKTYRLIIKNHADRSVGQLAMLKLGALQYQRGDYQQSFETLKSLLSLYPGTEFFRDAAFALRQAFDQRMRQLASNKDVFKLIDFYQSFEENLPQELKSSYAPLLGQAYLDLKLYSRAKELFQEAARKGTKDPKIMLGLALALFHEGDYSPAEKAMAGFLAAFPAHGLANQIRLERGQALLALNRPEEALKLFQEVQEKGLDGPEYWPAVEQSGRTLLKLGRAQESAELLGKRLAKAPSDLPERFGLEMLLGEALMASGDPRVAASVLAKALQERPVTGEFLGAYYLMAQARIKAGMMDQARETLTRIVQSPDPFWSKLAADRLLVAELRTRMALREAEVAQ